ncbi:hypothetical protein PCANC_23203 [Puccinia coronata f. sp. avenae]|uniref:Ubiquitin-like domain-containing protein n=1 Tax=Puccinia coronata f. sp. avenae TaxID=200324 RepID=A0A2N5UTH4_9BASI|nr:hypothetical protein PCANC_23203 [Puccinia coronata f. sp. avenae]PLW41034.1 hypothetical protein PCASD_07940 [Puccinia coronata f. sp. avenae]
MPVSIKLNSRSKPVKSSQVTLEKFSSFDQVCVKDIHGFIQSTYRLHPSRQRLTTSDKKVLDDPKKTLSDYGLEETDEIVFKDLGPQISWRMVFLIEYFGPLLIHPLFYLSNPISNLVYGGPVAHSRVQTLAFGMVMIHFLKREIETIFVHRFSNATMPFRNIFKNSFHYWVLSGLLLAGPIYGHASSALKTQGSLLDSSLWLYSWSAVWAYAEVSNLLVHLHLRSLRPAGSKKRSLPIGGYGFSLVACPNYTFETLAWVSYTAMVGFHWSGCLFSAISFIQMAIWSAKKLKNYRVEFNSQFHSPNTLPSVVVTSRIPPSSSARPPPSSARQSSFSKSTFIHSLPRLTKTSNMASAFSPHNPTAHLKAQPDHEEHGCCGGHGGPPNVELPEPTPLDELITIHNLSIDPESQKVSLSSKVPSNQKPTDQKLLQDTLAIINDLSQYLVRAPFPHCPPPPQMIQNNPRSAQINAMKEEGNAAFKANDFNKAIDLYTVAANAASTRPLFEPSIWIREELSVILCNRAAAYSSAKMWVEALCDAEVVIQFKRNWSKGHFRKAKALQGLGRIDEAKDAALLGLEFEPDNADLQAAYRELQA